MCNRISVLIGVLYLATLACGRPQATVMGPNTNLNGGLDSTLTSIQANTFTTTCGIAPCHVAGGIAPFRLDIADQSYASLVGVRSLHNPAKNRVTVNNPTNSYLLDIIQGNGANGAVMPPGGNDLLSQAQRQQISDWINSGAPNN